jgi:hypothetical protein
LQQRNELLSRKGTLGCPGHDLSLIKTFEAVRLSDEPVGREEKLLLGSVVKPPLWVSARVLLSVRYFWEVKQKLTRPIGSQITQAQPNKEGWRKVLTYLCRETISVWHAQTAAQAW